MSAADTGSVADDAEKKKWMKYAGLVTVDTSYLFTPIAIETLGAFGTEAKRSFKDIGCRLIDYTQDPQARSFPIQRLFVCIFKGNQKIN